MSNGAGAALMGIGRRAARRTLGGQLDRLLPTLALVVGIIAPITVRYHQLVARFPAGSALVAVLSAVPVVMALATAVETPSSASAPCGQRDPAEAAAPSPWRGQGPGQGGGTRRPRIQCDACGATIPTLAVMVTPAEVLCRACFTARADLRLCTACHPRRAQAAHAGRAD